MTYRALLNLTDGTKSLDWKITLDEDFKGGEELAELLASQRTFDAARIYMGLPPTRSFDTPEIRNAWIGTYADQLWEVKFETKDGFTKVVINGYDANATHIFMRVTVYHTPAEESQ